MTGSASLVRSLIKADPLQLSGFSEPFLRRLQTERVDFAVSEELGLAVLALYAATYYPAIGQQRMLPFTIARESFLEFTRIESVERSIRQALRASRVQRDGAQALIVPRGQLGGELLPAGFSVMVDAEVLPTK